jgi:hypothetical protein
LTLPTNLAAYPAWVDQAYNSGDCVLAPDGKGYIAIVAAGTQTGSTATTSAVDQPPSASWLNITQPNGTTVSVTQSGVVTVKRLRS